MKFEKLAEIKIAFGPDGDEEQKKAEMSRVEDDMGAQKGQRIKEAQQRLTAKKQEVQAEKLERLEEIRKNLRH